MSSFSSKLFGASESTRSAPFLKFYPLHPLDVGEFGQIYRSLYEEPLYQSIQYLEQGDIEGLDLFLNNYLNSSSHYEPQLTYTERYNIKKYQKSLLEPPATAFLLTDVDPLQVNDLDDHKKVRKSVSIVKKQRNLLSILLSLAIHSRIYSLVSFLINPIPNKESDWDQRLRLAQRCCDCFNFTPAWAMDDFVDLSEIDMADRTWFKLGMSSNESVAQAIVLKCLVKNSPQHRMAPFQFANLDSPDPHYGLAWWRHVFSYGRYSFVKALGTGSGLDQTEYVSLDSIVSRLTEASWSRITVFNALTKAVVAGDDVEMFQFAIELFGGWGRFWPIFTQIQTTLISNRNYMTSNQHFGIDPYRQGIPDRERDEYPNQIAPFEIVCDGVAPKITSFILENDFHGDFALWLGNNPTLPLESLINFRSRGMSPEEHLDRSEKVAELLFTAAPQISKALVSDSDWAFRAFHTPTTAIVPFIMNQLRDSNKRTNQSLNLKEQVPSLAEYPPIPLNWSLYFTELAAASSTTINSFKHPLPIRTNLRSVRYSLLSPKVGHQSVWFAQGFLLSKQFESISKLNLQLSSLPPLFILLSQPIAALELLQSFLALDTKQQIDMTHTLKFSIGWAQNCDSFTRSTHPVLSKVTPINNVNALHFTVAIASHDTRNETDSNERRLEDYGREYRGPELLESLIEHYIGYIENDIDCAPKASRIGMRYTKM